MANDELVSPGNGGVARQESDGLPLKEVSRLNSCMTENLVKVKRVKLGFLKLGIKYVRRMDRSFTIDEKEGTITYERKRHKWRIRKKKKAALFTARLADIATVRSLHQHLPQGEEGEASHPKVPRR